MHTWETPEVHQIWTVNQASQNDWPKETQRKYHIKITQTVTRAQLRDSPSVHMYCTLFPPKKYFTCFTTFCLCGNSFLQTQRARALVTHHWQAPCVFTLSPSLQHVLHSTSHWCIRQPHLPPGCCQPGLLENNTQTCPSSAPNTLLSIPSLTPAVLSQS